MDSLDQACELCYVAKKYMLPQLLKTCMEFIWKDVDCETALRAYEFAKLFDDSGILEKSMKVWFSLGGIVKFSTHKSHSSKTRFPKMQNLQFQKHIR